MKFDVESLPQAMRVEFKLRRCNQARCVLLVPGVSADARRRMMDEFAFSMHGDGEQAVFQAERYGGLGIFNNGGGVRCGLRGRYQVKGIGLNPLRGRSTPSAYSSGAMGLTEAVREFMWSQIVGMCLPHGSPEVVAVIDLGQAGSGGARHRYACVRESALRVSHFERSPHFKPHPRYDIAHDSLRVRTALELLAASGHAHPGNVSDAGFDQRLFRQLNVIIARHAAQLAAAKARRLVHGALSGSNACVDGGWLDFGSISQSPSFAALPHFKLGFWREHEYLLFSIRSICHSAWLHTAGRFPETDAFEALVRLFSQTFDAQLANQFCQLVGFDEVFLEQADAISINALVGIAKRMILAARTDHDSHAQSASLQAHPSTAALDLARCMSVAICHDDARMLSQVGADNAKGLMEDLRTLSSAYRTYAALHGIPEKNACIALMTTALRRCAHLGSLKPEAMDAAISGYADDVDALRDYCTGTTLDAAVAMRGRRSWRTEVGRRGVRIHYYDPVDGRVCSDGGPSVSLKEWLEADMSEVSKAIAEDLGMRLRALHG